MLSSKSKKYKILNKKIFTIFEQNFPSFYVIQIIRSRKNVIKVQHVKFSKTYNLKLKVTNYSKFSRQKSISEKIITF